MKIAYLVQYTEDSYDEITENIDTLLDAGDDVYIINNSVDIRDDITLAYCDEPHLHNVHEQDGALPADLSMTRGYLVQMKAALKTEEEEGFQYDYFITLSSGMLPIVTRKELIRTLEQYPNQDIYYVDSSSQENPDIKRRFEDYAFFTNAYDFQKSKIIRGMNKMTASIVHNFKQREINETLYLSYPWFILTHESAQVLVDHIGDCSDTFKMCLYPEEMAIATLLKKYSSVPHHNANLWLAGPEGTYQFMKPVGNVTQEDIDAHPECLFAAKIHSKDNLYVYQNYFDRYKEEIK